MSPIRPDPNELDVTPFVTSLVEKTASGALDWQPTAAEDTFVASLAGSTLRLELETLTDINEYGQPEGVSTPVLYILGEKGEKLWEVQSSQVQGGLWNLFKLVRRHANKVDERIATLMEALKKL